MLTAQLLWNVVKLVDHLVLVEPAPKVLGHMMGEDTILTADQYRCPLSLEAVTVDRDDRVDMSKDCLLYTSPSPRDRQKSRMPSSA